MIVEKKKKSNVVYYIDDEKKVVICKLMNCRYDALNCFYKIVGKHSVDRKIYENLIMNNTFTSKATCHENDKWDVNTGKRIALCKTLKKYYNSKSKRIEYAASEYNSLFKRLTEKKDIFNSNINRYDKQLDILME